MSPDALWWLNLASMTGIAILAVPAFSLNFRKKTLARISGIVARRKPGESESALDSIAEELESEAAERAATWRRIDEICLVVGYLFLLGSAVLRVVLDW